MTELKAGLAAEQTLTVGAEDTAARWGSGLVPVFSTPALVGMMEATAVQALRGHLETGQTTVGGYIAVQHMAATPVGMQVRVRAILLAVEGRKLNFQIQAWDAAEQIGEAHHQRFIIDEQRFMQKVAQKSQIG